MTRRQKQCYDYIVEYIANNGYAPTFDEIQNHMAHKAKSASFLLVKRLIKRGKLKKTNHIARGIEIVEDKDYFLKKALECDNLTECKYFVYKALS